MNIDIRDHQVFDSLDPMVIIRYLVARGWYEIKLVPAEMAVYELSRHEEEPARIWLPLSRSFSDYASVMSSAFRTLTETEQKSQLAMLDDLQTTAIGDVIRVGTEDRLDRADHTLLFSDGMILHEQAHQMALAGAWNAASGDKRRPVYPQSTRVEISQYLQKLRLAQTERGSYVIRLISPIREPSLDQIPLSHDIPTEAPFERRAVAELLRGLRALRQAAADAGRRGRFYFPTFEEAVPEGVSANLCDAVAPMRLVDYWRPVRVSVTWCGIIPVPQPLLRTEVEFEPSLMRYIREAATEFRRKNPEEIVLRGAVTDLHRPRKDARGAGEVRIYGVANGKARYVKIALNQEDYELAVDAHKTYREVSVSGTLAFRTPGQWLLERPTHFFILGDEQDEE